MSCRDWASRPADRRVAAKTLGKLKKQEIIGDHTMELKEVKVTPRGDKWRAVKRQV